MAFISSEQQRKQCTDKSKESLGDLWNNNKPVNRNIMGGPEAEKKRSWKCIPRNNGWHSPYFGETHKPTDSMILINTKQDKPKNTHTNKHHNESSEN